MSSSRFTTTPVYVPETIPITETVKKMQQQGKLKLRIKGQMTDDELSAQINKKGPASTAKDLKPGDEFDGSVSVLPIGAVNPYDRNPRTSPNPKYAEIKASILERGFKGNLTITKRPNTDRYMLYMGGTTRLQIVKELFAETGERRFAQVNCVYHDWISEADVLASFLIENEARGDTLFIEKARGLINLAREIERETGKTVTTRDIQATTAKMGMMVSHSTAWLYEFAVDHLQPLGPWLTRENVSTIKRRYGQHQAAAQALRLDGHFAAEYPGRLQRYQTEFASQLDARQHALREAGDKTTVVALRGETLVEFLRGFDRLLADALALDPAASRRIFAAMDASGKENLPAETLRTLAGGATAPASQPPARTAKVGVRAAPASNTAMAASTPDQDDAAKGAGRAPVPAAAPAGQGGSMPPCPVPFVASEVSGALPVQPGDSGSGDAVVAEPGQVDFMTALPSLPTPIAPDELLTEERFTAFAQCFFLRLKAWGDLTRISEWILLRDDLDLPYLFWLELPEEIALRGERDVRLEDVADENLGTLPPDMIRVRDSSYRLTALLSGQLGGVIEGDGWPNWTSEVTFAERLPPESRWRAAAMVDFMTSLDAFYNIWEDQMGGVSSKQTCQLCIAPHDLLSVLREPYLAASWTDVIAAYDVWGQALAVWRDQAPIRKQAAEDAAKNPAAAGADESLDH
jgi:ParB family protein of integrating conjugative element (PFGI_1 class)